MIDLKIDHVAYIKSEDRTSFYFERMVRGKSVFDWVSIRGKYTGKLSVYELEIFINKLIALRSISDKLWTEDNVNQVTKIGGEDV